MTSNFPTPARIAIAAQASNKSFIESGGKLHPLVGGEGQPPRRLGHWALGIGNFFAMPHARFPMPKNSIPLWVEFFIVYLSKQLIIAVDSESIRKRNPTR
ncbi:hypothetical protein FDUTEX481_08278 [Tolypothrix sp. PCC 7601]|nr:hypothetical protein FDUTEX481_08278 [Tolypothrix sp. PCC 7601]